MSCRNAVCLPSLVLAVTASMLAGCKETISSSDLRTNGIAMLTDVTARSESASTVRVRLLAGGDESNTVVILKSGDSLIAEAGDETQTMDRVEDGVYEADFDIGEGGTVFGVRLERGDDDDDAVDNSGELPEPFDIVSDLPDTYSRESDDLTFEWEPSGTSDDMSIEFDDEAGEGCIFVHDEEISEDDGSYLVEAGSIDSTGGDMPETCDVTATITRTRSGTADEALNGESRFRLHQVRSTVFESAP